MGRLHHVPAETTSFVGRRRELADVKSLLSTTRLLTLTGTGGVGKTRLALRAATEVARNFPDGVWLVELAGLQDPGLLIQSVVAAFDVRDQSAGWLVGALVQYLADRRLLLVLDNCEHLVDSCAVLTDGLLRGCPEIRVIATSRQGLGINGEVTYVVPPLPTPDADSAPEGIFQSDAVRLLAERAAAVMPGFAIDDTNRKSAAKLCRRLDGIPLAIELAAVRLRALSMEQVLERLDERFRLLTSGSRAALPRHQTLQATIDWSYDLLSDTERRMLRRLASFAGGFDFEAVEAVVCDDNLERGDVIDLLSALVERSMVMREPSTSPARFRLLETIRQYAYSKLKEAGEEAKFRRRHRDWCLALSTRAEYPLWFSEQTVWLGRLRREHDNLRAALEYCLTEPGEAAVGMTMASALYLYWAVCYLSEGRRWLISLIEIDRGASTERAKALMVAASLAMEHDDVELAQPWLQEGITLARTFGDHDTLCHALNVLGRLLTVQGNPTQALAVFEEAIALSRRHEFPGALGEALLSQALAIAALGDLDRAITILHEALAVSRPIGNAWHAAWELHTLGLMLLEKGDYGQATTFEKESLQLRLTVADRFRTSVCIDALAWIATAENRLDRGATLLGAARAQFAASATTLPPVWQAQHDRAETALRQGLGPRAFEAGVARGSQMTFEEAAAYALEARQAKALDLRIEPALLSPRQLQIAGLVARGLSNKEIAAKLLISERTAESHVENILNRLGLHSRSQIAAWSAEREPALPKGNA